MSLSSSKHYKMQEFVAHGANVKCLSFGRKSGRVMVTGGDDRKVNLWTIGNPNNVMSIPGHTTSVESVCFDPREVTVCAGSSSGALKVCDLEAAKIIRTLTGHKDGIRCLDFHPYGDYIASGSLDTNIKLWDARKKGCVYTYKGHNKAINTLTFSPDGKWVASGAEDGSVKLWDLSAGKLLTEFHGHSSSVTGVKFHPYEFLLASGSTDRTVKFWDLESFQLVSTTGGDCAPVRCISFHSSGLCMFSGSQDNLKVYGWEPACAYDSVLTGWGKVSDLTLSKNQLIGGSFSMNSVSIHTVQLDAVKPFQKIDNSNIYIPNQCINTLSGAHLRKNFEKESENQKLRSLDMKVTSNDDFDVENDNLNFDEEFEGGKVFCPKSEICRTPPKSDPSPVPFDATEITTVDYYINTTEKETKTLRSTYTVNELSPELPSPIIPVGSPVKTYCPIPTPFHQQPFTSFANTPPELFKSGFAISTPIKKPIEKATAIRRTAYPPVAVSVVRPNTFHPDKNIPIQARVKPVSAVPEYVPEQRDKPAGLNVDDFLPKSMQQCLGRSQSVQPEISEAEAMEGICREHQPVRMVYDSRFKKLQILLAVMKSKGPKIASETAVKMNDPAILVDFLSVLNRRHDLWTLDLCQTILPSVQDIVQSNYETYMSTGCCSVKLILQKFGNVIKSNIEAVPRIGVDVCGEERISKCKNCYEQLSAIQSFILKRQTMQGKLGQSFRELLSMLCTEFN